MRFFNSKNPEETDLFAFLSELSDAELVSYTEFVITQAGSLWTELSAKPQLIEMGKTLFKRIIASPGLVISLVKSKSDDEKTEIIKVWYKNLLKSSVQLQRLISVIHAHALAEAQKDIELQAPELVKGADNGPT